MVFSRILHVSQKMTYRTWGTWNYCFQNFSSSVPADYSTVCFIVPREENIKVKLLNFTLTMDFIFYVVVTSRSNCSLVFCSKIVFRLALAHSRYIGNWETAVIRIPRKIKFPLLSPPSPDNLVKTSQFDFIKFKLLWKLSENSLEKIHTEAVVCRCSSKEVFLKI